MTPDEFITRALSIPYEEGKGDWSSADCWGVVELYYRHVLDIELSDRGVIKPGHAGMQQGFEAATYWVEVTEPKQHCLVIMRAHGYQAGHVGIYIDGHVLHSDERTGCTYEPIKDRFIRSTITCFLAHERIDN